uniref:Endonuclease/exonuclease/phosphatase domain-containing protein n=1 Tax=Hucho hucho TaxID=62062 RepID=A0A4W5JYT8_9TELE
MNRELIVMSLYSQGLDSAIKRTKCLEYIRPKKVDVALIQETHLKHSDVYRFQNRYYKCVAHSSATNKMKGVLILFDRKRHFQVEGSDHDDAGRFVFVTTVINHSKMCFASIYCPNVPDSNFLSSISKILLDLSEYQLVVGGDFNQVCNSQLDRTHVSCHSQTDQQLWRRETFYSRISVYNIPQNKDVHYHQYSVHCLWSPLIN